MKKIYIILLTSICLTGCADFLDTDNLYDKSSTTYYATPQDIEEAMLGVYNALYTGGDSQFSCELLTANILSDAMLGGGGTEDRSVAIDKFEDPLEDTYRKMWTVTYDGIFRANSVIENVQTRDYKLHFANDEEAAEQFKNETLAEMYFMRGFFFFRAAKFFGGLPLIISSSSDRAMARSSHEETFAQIFSDFKMSLDFYAKGSGTAASAIDADKYGRANKWIAQGYMARAFLYYTGYMTNIAGTATTSAPLVDGTTLSKVNVLAYLDDCIANSGYDILPDFRNLWPYSYVNKSAGTAVLPWAETEGLAWAGQDGFASGIGTGNKEVMFSIRYAGSGDWEFDGGQFNRSVLYMGVRDNTFLPFGKGWGMCTIHKEFVADWDDNDPRKDGSVLPLGDADQGTQDSKGNFAVGNGMSFTGFANKKYTVIMQKDGTSDVVMFAKIYGYTTTSHMLGHAQDFIQMRFADVLLMHSELKEDAVGLNRVRARVGLGAVDYTLENLKTERMYEFAFEGLRWFDLVRWGDINTSNNYYGKTIQVLNGESTTLADYSITYPSAQKGLLPLPESEIRLSAGVYKQNPGW